MRTYKESERWNLAFMNTHIVIKYFSVCYSCSVIIDGCNEKQMKSGKKDHCTILLPWHVECNGKAAILCTTLSESVNWC